MLWIENIWELGVSFGAQLHGLGKLVGTFGNLWTAFGQRVGQLLIFWELLGSLWEPLGSIWAWWGQLFNFWKPWDV